MKRTTGTGYIKLHRQILDWDWYGDINTKIVFIHLLLTVNYKPKRWHGIVIDRGQRVASLADLADETGLTIRQIRTALEHLKTTGEVTKTMTSTATGQAPLITVENYTLYQDGDSESDKGFDKQSDKQSDKGATTTKERKNKEIRNRESTRARARDEKSKKSYGRFNNVLLTDEEYKELKEAFNNLNGLINKASIYFGKYPDKANIYGTHAALLWQIGTEDNWPRRKKKTAKPLELSKAEKEKIRQAEQDYLNQI